MLETGMQFKNFKWNREYMTATNKHKPSSFIVLVIYKRRCNLYDANCAWGAFLLKKKEKAFLSFYSWQLWSFLAQSQHRKLFTRIIWSKVNVQ